MDVVDEISFFIFLKFTIYCSFSMHCALNRIVFLEIMCDFITDTLILINYFFFFCFGKKYGLNLHFVFVKWTFTHIKLLCSTNTFIFNFIHIKMLALESLVDFLVVVVFFIAVAKIKYLNFKFCIGRRKFQRYETKTVPKNDNCRW